jgi:hypothetical protein
MPDDDPTIDIRHFCFVAPQGAAVSRLLNFNLEGHASSCPIHLGADDAAPSSADFADWVARASRVLVSASRRNNLFKPETIAPAKLLPATAGNASPARTSLPSPEASPR